MAEGGQESRGGNEDTVGIKALSVLYPFLLSSLLLHAELKRWGKTLFFKFIFTLFKCSMSDAVDFLLSHICHMWKSGQLYFLLAFILSSHPTWPSRFMSGHHLQRELKVTHSSSGTDERLCPSASWQPPVGPLVSSSSQPHQSLCPVCTRHPPLSTPPLEPCVVSVLANLWFSCEGHRSGRLTQFQLTDTIIHCLHWECWGCVRVAGTLPVWQPAWYFSAGSAETWPS